MSRRPVLLVVSAGVVAAVATLASSSGTRGPTVLERAAKAKLPAPPVAVLIEMGFKDRAVTPWSGRAVVRGATVAHREGYRFRDGDQLTGADGWEASSHRPLRAPRGQPAVILMEGYATVGVVLHLADVRPGATLMIEPKAKEFERADVPVADLLAGKPVPFAGGRAVVRRVSAAAPVVTAKTEDDFPAACYGPDGTLWVAYVSYALKEEERRVEASPLPQQPADFKSLDTPEYRDQLFVKAFRDGKWTDPVAVTGPAEDIARCAIAADDGGEVWLAYAANRGGTQTVHLVRIDRPGAGIVVPVPHDGPNFSPALCAAADGRLRLASMAWGRDAFGIATGLFQGGKPAGTHETFGGDGGVNHWNPAAAAGPDSRTAVAYDLYADGDYDVVVQTFDAAGARTQHAIAGSSKFEARPSIVYDAKGRLWVAYEEGPEQWGKDSGALAKTGNPLFSDRSVRVVCLDADGTLKRPAAELPSSAVGNPGSQSAPDVTNRNERATRYAYPQVGIDGKGRVWVTYRQNFGSRYTTHAGNYCLTYARRLDGDRWSEAIELHHSDGLLDSRPALLPHPAGGLVVVHNTDGRHTTPATLDNQIYMSVVDLPGDPVEPKLVPHDPGTKDPKLSQLAAAERSAVKRMREYRTTVGGKTYRPLRGEFHRHTDISWDGAADGSLEDMFRYAIDAAAMDWIGNGDHDNGAGREYTWWLTQKLTDAYHAPNAFTPMFTYERSVAYPMGHRNCMFARRGIRTLPRLAPGTATPVATVHPDDTKMLYRYLKELGGICASHTSATGMGTDWRDNDRAVEPVVEIYQGDRNSYEYPDAPRAGHDPQSGQQPVAIGGWRPAGFIDLALRDKRYRFGFESSSDHWSTHISYCVPLAERHDRAAILDAIKKRHCYGATDNILLDVHSGDHVMGDEFRSSGPPTLEVVAAGTGPIARVVVVKDSKAVATLPANGPEYRGTWTDPQPAAGVHYYYVRVEQADGQLAWGSPMWIETGR